MDYHDGLTGYFKMKDEIKFEGLPSDIHQCTSYRVGDTIIWKCPICLSYERKFNLVTNQMPCKGKTEHQHTGEFTGTENMSGLTQNLNEQ